MADFEDKERVENEARKMMSSLLVKAMEHMLEKSEVNVPQPLPLLEEKAVNRLSADDYISWQILLKEWAKISPEGKKVISSLLILGSHTLLETLNITSGLLEESKDTVAYINKHPEFKREQGEKDPSNFGAFMDALREGLQ